MGFPVSIEGTISLHEYGTTPALVAARIQEMLEAAQASEISVRGSEVHFVKHLLRPMWRGTVLVPFDSGRFSIEAQGQGLAVRYRLSTSRNARGIAVLLGSFGAIVVVALTVSAIFGSGDTPVDILDAGVSTAPLLAAMWLWTVGLIYLVAKIRTPFWLRRELLR